MPHLVHGGKNDDKHFDGWTPVTLANHLIRESELHLFNINEPGFHRLARYPMSELEDFHMLAHVSKLRSLEPMTDGQYERALAILNS